MHQYADISICSENDEKQGPKNRSYIASVFRGHLLALYCARNQGEDVDEMLGIYKKAPLIVEDVLKNNDELIRGFSNDLANNPIRRFMHVGTGFQYPSSCETSLKFTEVALIPSHAWELEETLHGYWYSMTDGEVMIVHAIEGPSFDKSSLLANGIRDIAEKIWVITNSTESFDKADFVTHLPKGLPESMYALLSPLPVYLCAYYTTVARGKNHPDHGPHGDQRFIDARWVLRQLDK